MPEERKNGRIGKVLWIASLIVAFVIQTAYFGVQVGRSAERLDQVERQQRETRDLKERVVRVETMVQATQENTERIERKLDRLIERRE